MGIYLNPGNNSFDRQIKSQVYVDKTGLIEYTNKVLRTEQRNVCISRPRRFGKSMAATMLAAYYDRTCDSKSMFQGMEISKSESFLQHLNKYDVIFVNIQKFLSRADSAENMLVYLQEKVIAEVKDAYPNCSKEKERLSVVLEEIYAATGNMFVFIIDEWDCIFREYRHDNDMQTKYLDFLRDLLKDADYISLAYMTGILPIKKYGTHSALNMFDEFSMIEPDMLAQYVGFTEDEVRMLCEEWNMDFEEMRRWYDGYRFEDDLHIYSPKSVVDAIRRKRFGSYWANTETYEALKIYINMNFDGLRDAVILMIGGEKYRIRSRSFQNDMTTFKNKDDVLTLLVHLGYLAYDTGTQEVFIPNHEVATEFENAVEGAGWDEVIKAISNSDDLLNATLAGDAETVAKGIESIHAESTSILNYNNENALSCVISLAYYSARNYYTLIRELPAGKGFADIVFLPQTQHIDKPAIIVELKWDKSVQGAIEQIKNKNYVDALKSYTGIIIVVGINYDKTSKKHQCMIEKQKKTDRDDSSTPFIG